MQTDKGLRRIVMAIACAVVSFGLVGGGIFYRMADVGTRGLRGGPQSLAAGMAGLFGGGLAALLALLVCLRVASCSQR